MEKGLFRIYIFLGCLYSSFFILRCIEEKVFINPDGGFNLSADRLYLIVMAALPIPLYLILKWIVKGFK